MTDKALLLCESVETPEVGKAVRLLGFFGIEAHCSTVDKIWDGRAIDATGKTRLLCSVKTFLRLSILVTQDVTASQFWQNNFHSAFIFAGDDDRDLQELAVRLAGDQGVAIQRLDCCGRKFVVADEANDFCGAMAGTKIVASMQGVDCPLIFNMPKNKATGIISSGSGASFSRFEILGIPVFVSTHNRIIDLDAELPTGIFNIRDHLLSALPVVLYIKWAWGGKCWHAPELNACLVIDDPLLKPAYGFVNFDRLLTLMKRHVFSTNIAFIPWNWRRSSSKVVQLFRENPEKYSLSVHGCDHTRAEFGSPDQQYLYRKVKKGIECMARHEQRTGICHDPVMVFPQGVFSEAAMSALRYSGLIGVTNNDTISVDPTPRAVKISDVWDIAVMCYSNFPIFTRRYPWEGVENFAFDMLLGKPCIIVIHHDYCSDQCVRLVKFVEQLNALKYPPKWRGLGDVIRCGFRQREISPDTVEVEMYGTEISVANRSTRTKRYSIIRREVDPSAIKVVFACAQTTEWRFSENCVRFDVELKPGESQKIIVKFQDLSVPASSEENLPYRLKTSLRRYLSEFRDNHLMKYQKNRLSRMIDNLSQVKSVT